MKEVKKVNLLNLIAFIGIMVIAVLQIFDILAQANVLTIARGGVIDNLFRTVKLLSIIIVMGAVGYGFVKDRKKGWLIAYFIAMVVIITTVILMWVIK